MKLRLIQNVVAPYRVPLFQLIAQTPGVDFKVYLLARRMKNYPHWERPDSKFPFSVEHIPGVCFQWGYERIFCVNPYLLWRLFRERPDVIVCAGYSPASLFVFLRHMLAGIKYAIWMEGTFVTEGQRRGLLWLRRILTRHAASLVDAGSRSREYLQSLNPEGGRPFFTAYNCIETQRFQRSTVMPIQRSVNNGPIRILYVGQLVGRKGVTQLLESYHQLVTGNDRSVELHIVGDGPLKSAIEVFVKKHSLDGIHLKGFVTYEQMPRIYWNSDLFVLLSIHDPNPLVLFEALTAGLPVVISERAGNACDFVIGGKNGFVVDPYNIEEVSSRMAEVLDWSGQKRAEAAAISSELLKKATYKNAAKAFVEAADRAIGQGT